MRATLEVHGEVDAHSALGVIRAAEKMGADELLVSIASSGGGVEGALDVAAALEDFPSPTVALVGASCESAALLILVACDRRLAYSDSTFLLHAAAAVNQERQTADVLQSAYNAVRSADSRMSKALARGTGMPYGKARRLLEREASLTAADALHLRFIDTIVENEAVASAAIRAAFDSLRSPRAAQLGVRR